MSLRRTLQEKPAARIAAVVLFILLLVLTGTAVAQTKAKPFVFGEVQEITSTVLGQKRTINVYLPDGYSDTTKYPVIYVLDGSANEDFPHIAGLAQFMNMYALLPPSIVVGIANVDRKHDFTFPTTSDSDKVWVPNSGGSAAFMDFIEKELQPFVERQYPCNGTRTIIGQSLGGLLATEVLFKRPHLFDQYIIVSPSLWWDNGSLAGLAEDWAKANGASSKRMFIAMGKDDDWSRPQVDAVVAALKKQVGKPLAWWYVPFAEETHMTILHRAVYKAFEVLNTKKK
jgi:uncharacterized protein